MNFYDISVQRWPLPWMTRFQVVDHFWSDDEKRLTLVKRTGDSLSFPRMDRRAVRVHPSYRIFKESQRFLPASEPLAEIAAPEAVITSEEGIPQWPEQMS